MGAQLIKTTNELHTFDDVYLLQTLVLIDGVENEFIFMSGTPCCARLKGLLKVIKSRLKKYSATSKHYQDRFFV